MPAKLTIAKALEIAGRKLQDVYGDQPIPASELKKEVAKQSRYGMSSIIPSDFCYNRTNAGIPLINNPMFIRTGRAHYTFVGMNYPYTGPMTHKPQGQPERVVGNWKAGKFTPNTTD